MSKTIEKPREEQRGLVRLKQGEVIQIVPSLLSSIQFSTSENSVQKTLVIVISHDCDIEAEAQKDPLVEVIPIELIDKLNSRNTHTRNARILEIEIQESTGEKFKPIRIVASEKHRIHKKDLWDKEFIHPYILSPETLVELVDWLSSRYRRAALPEEFGRRFKRIEGDFWKLMEEYNHCTLGILFVFDEGQDKKECTKGESYNLGISLVFKKGRAASDFDPLIEKIYTLFESNYIDQSTENPPEIEIRQCLAMSESDITLEAYRAGIHLRSEWISYGTEPHGPLIRI